MGSYLLSILIRYPSKSILGNKGFISAHSSPSVPAEKSQWQECDIAGHIASKGQKQGKMNLCMHANAQPTPFRSFQDPIHEATWVTFKPSRQVFFPHQISVPIPDTPMAQAALDHFLLRSLSQMILACVTLIQPSQYPFSCQAAHVFVAMLEQISLLLCWYYKGQCPSQHHLSI